MDTQQLYDIYGHWHVPFWQTRLFYGIMIAVIVVMLMVVLWWWKTCRKKSALSPEQHAFAALKKLQAMPIITRDDAQQAYLMLTNTLKKYFEYYYSSPFTTYTDQEMVNAISAKNILATRPAGLLEIAQAGTQVKFAREDAVRQQLAQHIEASINLINFLVQARKTR